jgi:hypothetical protein
MKNQFRSLLAVGAMTAATAVALPAAASPSAQFVHAVQYSIKLGTAKATNYVQAVSQSATNNDVYFAEGSKVLVVKGHSAPTKFVTAPTDVLALCATASDLYVETATKILEYAIPGASFVGSWALPSGLGPSKVTSAGMSVEGSHLWTWTDWSTDQSGYEYGSVVEFNTNTWTSKVYDKNQVDPGDAAASSLGYFFLANDHVDLVEPNGTQLSSPKNDDASDAPTAVLGNTVYLVATREPSGKDYLDSFSASTLKLTHSVVVASTTYGVLGTPLGLAGINEHGSKITVVMINPTTGSETDAVTVTGAESLLYGTTLSAVAEVNGEMYLDRLT